MRTLPLNVQRGFTLIEVMIVFFVLSVGLLGMAALQMKSMQYNQASYIRSQATVAAYDMLDRMRLNSAGVTAGDYVFNFGDALPAGGNISDDDLLQWGGFLANSLPTGQGQIFCAGTQCTVEVRWMDKTTGKTVEPHVSVTAQIQM